MTYLISPINILLHNEGFGRNGICSTAVKKFCKGAITAILMLYVKMDPNISHDEHPLCSQSNKK